MMTLSDINPELIREHFHELPQDIKLLVARLASQWPNWVWQPHPSNRPQQLAFASEADVVGYGGAAGGGKTDLIIGKALLQHKRVAVFRRNGTEHTAFVDRLADVLGTREGFNGQSGIWRNAGPRQVQIELGSMPNLGDERKYRGRPHDLKAFDEASELLEYQVRFLLTWLRTTEPGQRCQALLCFNPPTTIEGRWIIEFFAPWLDPSHPLPAAPGELRWFAMVDGKEIECADGTPFKYNGEMIRPLSRTFIPAKVTDNPYLMETGYMATLQSLPEPLRSQMLKGDFAAGMTDDPWQVIPTAWVEMAMKRWKQPTVLGEMMSLGCDVARGGKDKTIIFTRHADGHNNMWFNRPLVYPGTETPDGPLVMGLVVAASRDRAPQHIDVIGVGSSPYDFLVRANQPAVGVDVRKTSLAKDQSGLLSFANMRSELWWRMRELLDPANNTGIALPPERELLTELTTPRWSPEGKVIKIESRDDINGRLHRSVDYASALILASIDTPKMAYLPGVHGLPVSSYNPFGDTQDASRRMTAYDPFAPERL
jgi:hypothetical protein